MVDRAAAQPEAADRLLAALPADMRHEMLDRMLLIRAFEERAEALYALGQVHGTMHLSIGQEAAAVGASFALRRGHDYLLNHHRGHGHVLAWGSEVERMMAEFLGRETGYCRGRGGSMHIANVAANNLGANGIVAGGLPIAAGVGLSITLRRTDQVVLVIFGDGAMNEGAFHESMNLAAIWDLPVIYLCENNQYAMSMAVERAFRVEPLSLRAAAYGMPGETVDGNDVLAVYDAVGRAAARARVGQGPSLVEAVTYRWRGHSKSDRQAYRTRDEVKVWQGRDPIPLFAARLGESAEALAQRRAAAEARIDVAVAFAEASPEPEVSRILEGVYA
ncbi:MAG: thiamine pyrophosphate-dependent dehydrogenase E1 component subunit alpha [Anaerolineales bacterium]|nr:thiamine pyrophosphate-dependent dehydrogenase E1 component subunit alpha [Anaerolineales bacterium]